MEAIILISYVIYTRLRVQETSDTAGTKGYPKTPWDALGLWGSPFGRVQGL